MNTTRVNLLCCSVFLVLVLFFEVTNAQWKQIDGLSGGFTIDIAQHENGSVFAAMNNQGIFKSTDNGVNWTPTDSTLDIGDISALTIIGNRITVYTLHDGKFYSIDEGKHWAPVLVQGSDNQTFSVIEGENGELISQGYMVSSRSTDSGETWIDVKGLPNMGGTSMVIGRNGVLIARDQKTYGIIRSTDHGVSWSLPDTTLGKVQSVGKKNNEYIIAVSAKGYFYSTDDGISWTQTGTDLTVPYFTYMVAGPSGDLFTGNGNGVYRSSDGGKNWTMIRTGLANTNVTCLSVSSTGVIYAGTYGGGIFTSSYDAITWVTPLSGLALTPVYTLAVNHNGEIIAGTFKSGIFSSTANGTRLTRATNGLPANITVTSIVTNESDGIFAVTDSGLFRSKDNGEGWTLLNLTLPADDRVEKLITSGTGNVITVTEGLVYCSADQGISWTAANNGQYFPRISSLAVDKDSIIYAATTTGLLYSINGGMKWASLGTNLPRDILIKSISVTSNHILLAGVDKPGIYRSIDNGASWLTSVNGVPDSFFASIIISDNNGNCFAGSNNGVLLLSTDDGLTWKRIDDGFPETNTYCLAVSNSKLFASTSNKGIWSRSLSEITGIRYEPVKFSSNKEIKINWANRNKLSMTITFKLLNRENVECSVYNMSGRKVASLVHGNFMPGKHSLSWNTGKHANGCYVVNVRTGPVCSREIISILR